MEDDLLKDVYKIASNTKLSFDDKIQDLLELGRVSLDLELGIVSHIHDNDYAIKYTTNLEAIQPETQFVLGDTYCAHTFCTDEVKYWEDVSQTDIALHPCYESFGLNTYIGVTIFCNDEPYGTVNYTAVDKRGRGFSNKEINFMTIVSQFIGNEITNKYNLEQKELLIEAKESQAEILTFLNKQEGSLEEMLDGFLERLLNVSWLEIEKKAGVFIKTNDDSLSLVSKKYLSPELHDLCRVVPYGDCLCGMVAETKEVIHKSCVDGDHHHKFEGMKPHGHYSVPIIYDDELVGVLILYLAHGKKRNEDEVRFLKNISMILGQSIRRYQLLEKLEHANSELEEFAYRTSHDLRSPLISSLGLIKLIEKMVLDDEPDKARKSLSMLEGSLERLKTLIDDILELTRTKNEEEAIGNANLKQIVSGSLESIEHIENFKRVKFEQDLGVKNIDNVLENRLVLIVDNLISNAYKYQDLSKERSTITVRSYMDHNTIVIEVEDNGLGIPEDSRDTLFQMFKRYHSRTSFGSGLGLYMIKKSADILGADIEYIAKDDGSIFRLRLNERKAS